MSLITKVLSKTDIDHHQPLISLTSRHQHTTQRHRKLPAAYLVLWHLSPDQIYARLTREQQEPETKQTLRGTALLKEHHTAGHDTARA